MATTRSIGTPSIRNLLIVVGMSKTGPCRFIVEIGADGRRLEALFQRGVDDLPMKLP